MDLKFGWEVRTGEVNGSYDLLIIRIEIAFEAIIMYVSPVERIERDQKEMELFTHPTLEGPPCVWHRWSPGQR